MKHQLQIVVALGTLAAAGVLCALVLAPTAGAWDWNALPNGYSVHGSSLGGGCSDIAVNGTHIGSTCDAGFQSALDAYVDSTICTVNPAAGGDRCLPPTTSTTESTTTQAAPAPPVETTTSAPAPQPDTTTAADTTQTVTATTAETVTVTVTTQSDPTTADLAVRLSALEDKIAALTSRVDRIANAGDAAWLAFQQAIGGGADPATAADQARGTYLNAVNGLGAFAS